MRNLHRITGAAFEHAHPECATCATCAHRKDGGAPGFDGYCAAKERTLCCPKPRRCREWAPSSLPPRT